MCLCLLVSLCTFVYTVRGAQAACKWAFVEGFLETALNSSLKGDTHIHRAVRVHRKEGLASAE